MSNILSNFQSLHIDTSGMSKNQLFLFKGTDNFENLRSQISEIQSVQSASAGTFDSTTAQSYANTIQDLEANQAALLLSTQGLTDAQIAETLAAKEANVAKNYQAMKEAGLLKNKQSLTQAQVQQNLQAVLGEEADTSAAMAAMGLSAAIEGEEHQVVQITSQKLREAVTTGELTEAQAQELAMRTGITVSMNEQAASGLPRWIASMKTATAAVWLQVKAQAAMMAANPMTWIMGFVAVAGVIKTLINNHKQSLEETRQETEKSANAYKESASSIDNYAKRYNELHEALLKARGNEEETYNVKKQLFDLQTEINDKFGEEYGTINLVTDAYRNQTNAIKAYNKEAAQTFLKENRKGIRQAKEKMEYEDDYSLSYSVSVYSDEGKALKEIAEKYEEQGIYLSEEFNGSQFSVRLKADPQSAYETIQAFKNDVRDKAKEFENEGIFDHVIDVSSQSLNDAKAVIDDYGNMYKQALTAEIVSDDDKSILFGEALKAVEAYNEAVLQSENPFDDENVKNARQSLQEIRDTINNDSGWEEYGSVVNDVFDQADTRLYDFSNQLKEDASLNELANDLMGFSDLDLQSFNQNFGDNASFDKLKESANSCGISVDELTGLLVNMGIVQEQIAGGGNTFVQPAFDIESFSNAIESLSDLQATYNDFYNNVKEKTDFTFKFSDIEKLREDFGEVCQSFDEFEKLAASSSTTAEQMQKAFDGLATEFVFNSDVMDGLSSSTREQIISQLELQGLLGVNQLLTEDFTRAYENAAAAGLDFSNATLAQISGFIQEGQYAEDTKQKIYLYALQKMLANENCLSTYGDILTLEALCKNLGIATEALDLFARAKNLQQRIDDGTAYPSEVKWLERTKDEIKKVASEVSLTSSGYTNMSQSAANAAKSADKGAKSAEKEADILSELISEMDKYKSKLKAVEEARETYNEYGKITADQAKDIVDADFKLLAAYGDEQAALEDLGKAKLNEMQIQLARNAIDTINKIQSEAEATRYLAGANEHLVGTSLDATEAMLQQAVAAAKLRGELQGQAADTILKGYQNGAMMLGKVDFGFDLSETENARKDAERESEKQFEKQFNWIERLLDKFSRITDKWKSTADKFTSWWNKNWSLDKAIRSNRKEIESNVDAYNYYNKKANSVGLSKKYRDLVDNGKISIQDIHDEELAEKIDKYIEWKDKMRDCIDTIEELYDAERDMIRQKFDNMIEYYDTVNTKVQSIVSKVNSLFDLNEARGKRTDINDLLEKFNGYSHIIGTTTSTTDGDSGADIKQHLLSDDEAAEIKKEIEYQESSIYDTATYKKLLNDIEKLEADKEKKGAKFSKTNEKKLQNYYKKKKALEENATADTVTSYAKIYDAYLKLQNKLDAGKSLTKAQRVKYNDYVKQLEEYSSARSASIADLNKKLEDNVETSSVEAVEKAYDDQKKELEDSYKRQIEDVKGDVQGTQQYKNLIAKRDNLKDSIDDLTAKKEAGTIKESENKKLKKYLAQFEALEAKIAAIDEGATSENISDYIKAYDRLVELQSKKKLTGKEAIEYDNLTAQLKAWNTEKQDILESLNRQLADAMEELDAAQLEAVNETTADIAKSRQEAYEIAKQIAELQVSTLENELALIDSALSEIEKRLGLYKKFSADTLKDLGYLDADDASTQDELYTSTFTSFIEEQTKKRVNLLNQKDIYEKLIDAVANNDYNQIAEMYKDGVFEQYGNTFDKVVEMLNDNTFDGFSATWVDEWTQSLDKVESDIYDLDMSLQDLKDQFREEVTFRAINDAIEKLGYLKDVVKDASGLIDDELLYDADGSFSEFGTAKAAALVEQLELAQQLAYEYAQKIAVAQADTSYASDKDKEAAIQELRKSYNQQILEAKGYSDSIVSLYKNQAKQEVDALKNIIAKRKEALQAKKAYYDYDKSIKGKTKDIEAIQAQIAALTGIDSAEARARKAQLESDLADLNDELDEMKKEHEYTLQINALDDFSGQLSETLENAAKDAVEILNEQKGIIESATKLYQQSSDVIQNTIDTLARFYSGNGIDLGQTTGITPITEKTSDVDVSSIDPGNGIRELKPGESLGLSEETFEKFKSLMPFNVCDNPSYVMFDNMQSLMHVNNEMMQSVINAMQEREVSPVVIQNHYDCLLRVDGNVDREFGKLLPSQLEQSFQYNMAKMANELHKLGLQRVYT